MRCLHCNKKLSLLKMAKGDQFCSSEHFDAHQRQLSKDAIERLMGVPDMEGPKPPLVVKKAQEEAPPRRTADLREVARQQDAPPAAVVNRVKEEASPRRDVDLRAIARQEEAPPAAEPPVEQAPPYALFIVEPPPPLAIKPPAPVAGELDPDTSSARELSFPIQEIVATACLLNLHARVSPAETTPLNWTSARNFILAAEGFPREVVQPSFIPDPDFPKLESSAPEPTLLPIDAISIEPAAPIVPLAPAEKSLAFLMAPSFLERPAPLTEVDPAGPVPNPSALVPALDTGLNRPDFTGVIVRPEHFEETAAPVLRNFNACPVQGAPELPISLSTALPATAKEQAEKAPLNGRLASSRIIGFSGTILEMGQHEAPSIDFALPESESVLVQPSAALPDPKRTLDGQPRITRTILPMPGSSIAASEPLHVPPGYGAPITLAAQRLQTRAVNIAFPKRMEIHPFGTEPAFADHVHFRDGIWFAGGPLQASFGRAAFNSGLGGCALDGCALEGSDAALSLAGFDSGIGRIAALFSSDAAVPCGLYSAGARLAGNAFDYQTSL